MVSYFDKLLVANRGEVASRIMRTCKAMGIASVAVFSEADRGAPFVRDADEAVCIGGAASADSYLRMDRIIEAAKQTGAQAIHPGFGFLAENAEFARQVTDAGLIFVGPSATAIELMGSKQRAKALVVAADVPVIPGYQGEDQSQERLIKEAKAIGFPLLLKASAGGGGKGMRVVRKAEELEAAIEGAIRESAASFGDSTLLIERYVESPRHIEIQVLGDTHGQLIHLFERECSIQRRHQKIIEEAPSVALSPELRERMGRAAVAACKAVDYVSAGTVEFLLAPDGQFYFLEVNTRLQVEHPVTEEVTGVDIVREQIRVAWGLPLSVTQEELAIEGHSIEVRIYAEDADNGFLPTTGRLFRWQLPDIPGLRVESGVESGSEVSIHYDPMLAKLIVTAPSRYEAIAKMRTVLRKMQAFGVTTNQAYLGRLMGHKAFISGDLSTHFIADHGDSLRPQQGAESALFGARVAALVAAERNRASRRLLPSIPGGFRNHFAAYQTRAFLLGEERLEVAYRELSPGTYELETSEDPIAMTVASRGGDCWQVESAQGHAQVVTVLVAEDRVFVQWDSGRLELLEEGRYPSTEAEEEPGSCTAPMPGKVVKVCVAEGQAVAAGEPLVILEAMKMEHTVSAPEAGNVAKVAVETGEQVEEGAVLAVVLAAAAE